MSMVARKKSTKATAKKKTTVIGPKGLRKGRLILYNDQPGKVIATTATHADVKMDNGDEINVKRDELSYPLPVKKMPVKKVAIKGDKKPVVKKDAKDKIEAKEKMEVKKETDLRDMFTLLRPDYVVVGFSTLSTDEEHMKNFITKLKSKHITFAFAMFNEGSDLEDSEETINKLGEPHKYLFLKHAIERLADPEQANLDAPQLKNDVVAFYVGGARSDWLLKLLSFIRDDLRPTPVRAADPGPSEITLMLTLSIEEDLITKSRYHNVLFIGY
jgi:hypothetical protein